MKQLYAFTILLIGFCTMFAAVAFPHFGLALLGIGILAVIWKMACNIVEYSREYETEEGP